MIDYTIFYAIESTAAALDPYDASGKLLRMLNAKLRQADKQAKTRQALHASLLALRT